MKFVLLTGATGLIGRKVAKTLRLNNFNVIECSRLARGCADEIVGDISDNDWIENVVCNLQGKNVVAIIHLAAQPTVWKSIKSPKVDLQCNVTATLNVIEVMNVLSVPKLVFASSEAVYGDIEYPDESSNKKPLNPYGISKAAAENYIKFYSNLYGFDYTIVRPSFVIGEGLDRNIIFDILDGIETQTSGVKLNISTDSKFNFVDVSCVANTVAHLLSLERNYEQINIVGRTNINIAKIITLIENYKNQKINLKGDSQIHRIACLRSLHMDVYDQYQVNFEDSLKTLITSKINQGN